ncbi:hypothetical protein CUJ84_pRLN3000478 (plasmid) [Rhizobium leguminosarum]|uniref:Uncharacterized protein n=1 Tax=Rhizobium leguminosarum TaxID=384 RepID=A0A2K9ZH78_RHILE|nr:hypothetical protein CUJ84_pRLN3000478 [Rhizobium leguminosarum]
MIPDRSQWLAFSDRAAWISRALLTGAFITQYALKRAGSPGNVFARLPFGLQLTLAPSKRPDGSTGSPLKSHVFPVDVPGFPTGPASVTPRITTPVSTGFAATFRF